MSAIELGGPDFHPGSPETLTVEDLSSSATSATLRFSANTLGISGTHSGGGTWVFVFDADDSGAFDPTPGRFDAQIVYNDGSLVEAYLITGARKIGTVPSDPGSSGRVTSITMGDGLSSTPDPITSTGTVSLDAATTDLSDMNAVAPIATGQVLKWNNSSGKYDPGTPALADNSDFGTSTPASGDVLKYDATASEWEPASLADIAPEEGTTITLDQKAYRASDDSMVYAKRTTVYHAQGGTGGGAFTVIASGVYAVISVDGYWDDGTTRENLDPQWVEVESGACEYTRSTHPAATGDGALIVATWVPTA